MARRCPLYLWYSPHVAKDHEIEESRCVCSMRIDFPSTSHDGFNALEILL